MTLIPISKNNCLAFRDRTVSRLPNQNVLCSPFIRISNFHFGIAVRVNALRTNRLVIPWLTAFLKLGGLHAGIADALYAFVGWNVPAVKMPIQPGIQLVVAIEAFYP